MSPSPAIEYATHETTHLPHSPPNMNQIRHHLPSGLALQLEIRRIITGLTPNAYVICMAMERRQCGQVPFASESLRAVKKTWHKLCFKCNDCGTLLSLGKESVHEGTNRSYWPTNTLCRVLEALSLSLSVSAISVSVHVMLQVSSISS